MASQLATKVVELNKEYNAQLETSEEPGKSIEKRWKMYGIMEYHHFSVEDLWKIYGISLVFSGRSMENRWNIYVLTGASLDFVQMIGTYHRYMIYWVIFPHSKHSTSR